MLLVPLILLSDRQYDFYRIDFSMLTFNPIEETANILNFSKIQDNIRQKTIDMKISIYSKRKLTAFKHSQI